MDQTARLLSQRSSGLIEMRLGPYGVSMLRESGCSKLRIPAGGDEAILINTSGGLAGGDRIGLSIGVAENAQVTITTQAAERVYRSLGPPADVEVRLAAEENASLAWLPLETILFDGASLHRRIEVDLAPSANFTALESLVLGRTESGETVRAMALNDRWRVRRGGKLLHAEFLAFSGAPPDAPAALAGRRAFATLLHFTNDADRMLGPLRRIIGNEGGVSAWNGKLVARLLARDGFDLRKQLKRVLMALRMPQCLPKTWAM